jgi:hypothetical protein
MMTGRGTAEWALTGRMGIELSYARALAAHVPIQVVLTARFRELAAAEAALQAETILPAQAVPARRVRPVQHRSGAPGKAAEHRCHSRCSTLSAHPIFHVLSSRRPSAVCERRDPGSYPIARSYAMLRPWATSAAVCFKPTRRKSHPGYLLIFASPRLSGTRFY